MKYAAGIVLYNPEIDRLEKNINSVINQVDKIYLIDNNSKNIEDVKVLLKKISSSKIDLTLFETNKGLALALNTILGMAKKDKYKWVLTLDQDSISPMKMLESFTKYVNEPNVGIICPVVYDSRKKNKSKPIAKDGYEFVNFSITSGSLTNVDVWEKVGKFDEYLFIDLIDNEFCYKLSLNGFKIIRDNSIVLDHEFGVITQSKFSNLFLKLGNILHSDLIKKLSYKKEISLFRRYYSTRNSFYLQGKYSNVPEYVAWSKKNHKKNIMYGFFRSNQKIKYIKMVKKAKKDAKEYLKNG